MRIDRLDHLVLTVASIDSSCAFYQRVLGMTIVGFGQGRTALSFGNQKINLHQAGREFVPHAHRPVPGSADLCFITAMPLDAAMDQVRAQGVEIIEVRSIAPGRRGRCAPFISATRTRISSKSRTMSRPPDPRLGRSCQRAP